MRTFALGVALALASCSAPARRGEGSLVPVRLRVEYRKSPLGIDDPRPRLSWALESSEPDQRQTAYEVRVNAWESGRVASAEQVHAYAGPELRSGEQVRWSVRVWDRGGKASAWSAPEAFEMALLRAEDWRARWILRKAPPVSDEDAFKDRPAPLFRKEFRLEKPLARARAYVTGLGHYELRLNGERVGDHVLDPGWTTYPKRVLYSTYDVTRHLKPGPNAAGVMLGNGWYDPLPLRMWGKLNLREHLPVGTPRLICQIRLDFADGTSDLVVSDESWKSADGPLLRNGLYLGEVYDARLERDGWDRPGFDDSAWEPAAPAEAPGPLRAPHAPPVRVTRTLTPVKVTEPKPGVFVFDLGQNFAGWARLRVRGEAGTRVTLRFGELLYPDGTLNGMTAVCGQIKRGGTSYRYDGAGAPRTAFQQDVYVLRGGGEEVYTPRFTFHGFRYVEVTGFPGRPGPEAIEGLRLNSDVEPAGSFSCSNELFNRIQEMVLRTQLSNMFSVQSDCPHREKFGYGGDIVGASEMAILNLDMARFYAKAVEDLADAARANGGMTETAPYVGIADQGLGDGAGPVGWGTAFPLLLWQLYEYYGDRRILEEHFEAAKRWVALLESRAVDGILDNGISDHESLVPKPRALTGTGFYFWNASLVARIARVLGREDDRKRYEDLARRVRDAFNRRFLKDGQYDTGTQACQAFALYLGLAPEGERARALDLLVKDVLEKHQGHLTTGIFGTKFMLMALTDLGRADVAYAIANQRDFPGWGHMLEKGATTLWEHWAWSDNTYSHNHPMFGSVSEWFVKALAGIRPAHDRVLIRPHPVGDLRWAKGRYDAVRGRVESSWTREGNRFALEVSIPPNLPAVVELPDGARHAVGSGRHRFESRLP